MSTDPLENIGDQLRRIADAAEKIAEQGEPTTMTMVFNNSGYKRPENALDVDLSSEYCLNDDHNVREKSSPCVLLKDHPDAMHKDDIGGTWPV